MTDSTMRAAIYRRPGEMEVIDLPIPTPGPAEVLVEVDFCGICGTDLHMVIDGWGAPDSVLGHEWSGHVVAPGDTDLHEGDRVVGRGSEGCGECDPCLRGRPSLCRDRSDAGVGGGQGAFARFVTARADHLVPVPADVDQRGAAFTEPLAVSLHAVTLSHVQPGQRALVFGAGPIGAGVIALLRARDVEVTAVEPAPIRAGLAERLGAATRRPEDLEITDHPGQIATDAVDVVFETSGARPAAEAALTQLVGGGTMVIVGTGMDHPRLDTNRVLLNELVVTGAFNYDRGGFEASLDLIGSGVLPLDDLLESEAVGLSGLLGGMNQLRAGELAGKVLVQP